MKKIYYLLALSILSVLFSCSSDREVAYQSYEIIIPGDTIPDGILKTIKTLAEIREVGDSMVVFPTISIRGIGSDESIELISNPKPRAQTNSSNRKFLEGSLNKQLKRISWGGLNSQVSSKMDMDATLEQMIVEGIFTTLERTKSAVFILGDVSLDIEGVKSISSFDQVLECLVGSTQTIDYVYIFIYPSVTKNKRTYPISKNIEASILSMDHDKLKEKDAVIAQQLFQEPSDPELWYNRALINARLSSLFDSRLYLEYASKFAVRQGENQIYFDRINTAQRDNLRPLFRKFPRHMEAILYALEHQVDCVIGIAPYVLYNSPKRGYRSLNLLVGDQLYTNTAYGLRILCSYKDHNGDIKISVSLPRYKGSEEVNLRRNLQLGQSIYHKDEIWQLEIINDSPVACPEHVRLLLKIERSDPQDITYD